MSKIFHHSTNTLRGSSFSAQSSFWVFLTWVVAELDRSNYATRAMQTREQPVPFSHAPRGRLGLDAAIATTTVETSSFANIPPTKTCMNLPFGDWLTSPTLEPVRASFRNNTSIPGRGQRSAGLSCISITASTSTRESAVKAAREGDRMPLNLRSRTRSGLMGAGLSRHPRTARKGRASSSTTMGYQPGASGADRGRDGRRLVQVIPDSRRAHTDQLFHLPSMSDIYDKRIPAAAIRWSDDEDAEEGRRNSEIDGRVDGAGRIDGLPPASHRTLIVVRQRRI